MNWYKMAQINNWDDLCNELRIYLEREPTASEIHEYVQKRMLNKDFDDSSKEPVVAAKKDIIPGGNADKKSPSDFSKKDVERGKAIEKEHTNNDDIAKEITIDHLEEHKDYYVGLEHMENALKEIEERDRKKK
jgi:hypothetical protein